LSAPTWTSGAVFFAFPLSSPRFSFRVGSLLGPHVDQLFFTPVSVHGSVNYRGPCLFPPPLLIPDKTHRLVWPPASCPISYDGRFPFATFKRDRVCFACLVTSKGPFAPHPPTVVFGVHFFVPLPPFPSLWDHSLPGRFPSDCPVLPCRTFLTCLLCTFRLIDFRSAEL